MSHTKLQASAAYVIFALCILAALLVHAVPALIAGLLSFAICRALFTYFSGKEPYARFPERMVTLVVGVGSVAALVGVGIGVSKALCGETLSDLLMTLARTLEQSKQYLPKNLPIDIPESVVELKHIVADAAKEHAAAVAGIGSGALHSLALVLVGWLVGGLAACAPHSDGENQPMFFKAWVGLWSRFVAAFTCVGFAQVKVASINTICMGIFLLAVAPMIGWHIPYAKTLVFLTFVCGLLPVVGNLISNTLTCVMALTVSIPAAVTSLAVLVVIHKAEYLIISKALGAETGTRVWELLIVLFAGELIFGMPGMVCAPIIYTFIRAEMRMHKWLPQVTA